MPSDSRLMIAVGRDQEQGTRANVVRWGRVLAIYGVAAVFVLAGIMKLFDPSGMQEALASLGFTRLVQSAVVWVLPPAEILLGFALILSRGGLRPTAAAMGLLVAFSVVLVRLWHLDQDVACGCFGRAAEAWFSASIGSSLARNGVMFAGLWFALLARKSELKRP